MDPWHPTGVRVPGILVDALVLAPEQLQTTHTYYDPAISGELRRPLSTLEPVPFTLEKVMARRAAAELQAGEIANLGFGVSALVPHVLVEEGLADAVSLGDRAGRGRRRAAAGLRLRSRAEPRRDHAELDQFTLLQGGGFDRTSLLSFLEIDRRGNVNVHSLPKRRHVTAGVGGFADITSAAPAIVFVGSFTAGRRDITIDDGALHIHADGPHTKFVNEVDSPTFSGKRALANGQKVLYVTERAVLELRPEGLDRRRDRPGGRPAARRARQVRVRAAGRPEPDHHVVAAVRSSTRRTHADSPPCRRIRGSPHCSHDSCSFPIKKALMTLSDSTLTDNGRVTLGWNPTHTVATVLLDRPTKLNALSTGNARRVVRLSAHGPRLGSACDGVARSR